MEDAKKLETFLSPLCSSDEDQKILHALCEKVEIFDDDSIEFDNGEQIEWEKDESIVPADCLPASYVEIAQVATTLLWDGGGPDAGFDISDGGDPCHADWLFEDIEEGTGDLDGAFTGGQNGIFFDASRKLDNGEPALAFIGHGDDEIERVESVNHLNYKQIFLRLMSDAILGSEYIPEIYY